MSDETDPACNPVESPSPDGHHDLAAASGEPVEVTAEPAQSEDSLDAELQTAQAAAIAKGKVFAVSEGNYDVDLADLLPEMSRVRKNLHQRQAGYKKGRRNGAPNWSKWLKFWRPETGVKLCDKTIKKLLDEFDQITPAPRPKKVRAKTITPAEARKMGLALLAMHEALSNPNEQGNVLLKPEDIAPILEMAPFPEQLNHLLESLRQDTEAAEPSQAALAAVPDPAETAGVPSVSDSSERPELRTPDAVRLTSAVIQKCASDFKAIPTGQPPSKYAEIIHCVAKGVAKQLSGPGIGGFSIKVSHIPAKRMASAESGPSPDPEQPSLFSASLPSLKVA